MKLTHLSLTNFRNFSRLDLDVPGGLVILEGGNAQGKTSLLESIFYLATYTSFHTSSDRQLINFIDLDKSLAVARIVADFEHKNPFEVETRKSTTSNRIEVRLIQEEGIGNGALRFRKEVLLDNLPRKISEVVGVFNAVLFLPQMLRIVEGSPEERRRYLNLAMGQVLPGFTTDLIDYSNLLAQRNALLKQLNERGGDFEQLNYWDERLSITGGRIILSRIRTIKELEQIAGRLHHNLTRNQEILRLSYQPSFNLSPLQSTQYSLPFDIQPDYSGISLEEIQKCFQKGLHNKRNEEIARGMTTIGPHRDELRFLSNGIDLGIYGSRGQARSLVISLKLAEVAWMKEKTAQWPVLLLDEIFAELDAERRNDLHLRLMESEQVILTTTDLDGFPADFVQKAKVWRIQSGQVKTE